MKKKILLCLPLVLLLTGCNILNNLKKNSSSTNTSSGDVLSFSNEEGFSSGTSSPIPEGMVETTFDFTKTSFTNNSHLDSALKLTDLANYMNESANIVSSIDATNCHFRKYTENDSPASLILGSAGKGGSIEFTFSKTIKKIIFTIQGYSNYYDGIWHPDVSANMSVEGHDYNLAGSETSTALPTYTKSIEVDTTVIEFSNTGENSRAFLHSLTVQYTA